MRLPPFPVDCFPPQLRHYCEDVASATQTPLEMAAMAMLGALSTVSLGAQVDAGNGWTEELGLYVLVVMAAAERKSSVMRTITKPLRELEQERREQELEELLEARSSRAAMEYRRKRLLQKYGQTDDSAERREIWEEVKDCDKQLAMYGNLEAFRLLADDVTAESLTRLLAAHGRIGILSAEGSAIDNIVGARYSEGKAAKLDIVLKSYAGEPHITDRTNRESDNAERPLLSITLAVQEEYLTGLIDHARSRSLGLVSRFVFVTPRSKVGRREIEPDPITPQYAEAWSRTLRHIHTVLLKESADRADKTGGSVSAVGFVVKRGSEKPLPLSLTPEARARLRELEAELEARLGPRGDLSHIADWAGRHLGRVLRIAGILHLASRRGVDDPIDIGTFTAAEDIGEFLMAHGRNALEETDTASLRAVGVLEEWDNERITLREIHRRVFNGRGKVGPAKMLADELVERGLLEPVPAEPGRPGRPSPEFRICLNGARAA